MSMTRIVTGRDGSGKSVVSMAGAPPRHTDFTHVPGFRTTLLWATRPMPELVRSPADPTPGVPSWVPPPGGTTFMRITFPPDSVMMSAGFDPAAAAAEFQHVLPGLAESFEADSPGMHATETVDYGILLDGELTLELDDGVRIALKPFDVVVQNGVRHAWRNPGGAPATMMFVLIGGRSA